MITREPVFYRDFRCLGGACPMTCCRDWEIVLDEDAIADYQNAPGALCQAISEALYTDDEGDVCFRLRPDGLCALLDGDGLCPIQRNWGEAHLCAHCAAYPRFNEEYGCLTENIQAISCPEAARLVMEEGIFPLRVSHDGVDDPPYDGVDPRLLAGLIATRESAFRMLNNRSASIWSRLAALLRFAGSLQARIDQGLTLMEGEQPLAADCGAGHDRQGMTARLLALLAELEPLRPQWPELLARRSGELSRLTAGAYADLYRDFQAACPLWDIHLERLVCYFVFRHWPKVVNDDMLYGRAALSTAACLTLFHLSMLAWREDPGFSAGDEALLWSSFSREIEHLEENFDTLVYALDDENAWPLAEALGN